MWLTARPYLAACRPPPMAMEKPAPPIPLPSEPHPPLSLIESPLSLAVSAVVSPVASPAPIISLAGSCLKRAQRDTRSIYFNAIQHRAHDTSQGMSRLPCVWKHHRTAACVCVTRAWGLHIRHFPAPVFGAKFHHFYPHFQCFTAFVWKNTPVKRGYLIYTKCGKGIGHIRVQRRARTCRRDRTFV